MGKTFTISQLAEVTGVPTKTIRYYEEVGVLPPPERNESRYRLYSDTDVRRLELIRRARLLDMSLPEVRELLERALQYHKVQRILTPGDTWASWARKSARSSWVADWRFSLTRAQALSLPYPYPLREPFL